MGGRGYGLLFFHGWLADYLGAVEHSIAPAIPEEDLLFAMHPSIFSGQIAKSEKKPLDEDFDDRNAHGKIGRDLEISPSHPFSRLRSFFLSLLELM